jgi:ubiquinone/menaquinone biosynthesis C-methylase UbiE
MLPFRDQCFDVVHCSAVIEHVGNLQNQKQLVAECARVARRGFLITTPYRWFPIEVHTSIPFLHWLPKAWHRAMLSYSGYDFYSAEENLNLMDKRDFHRIGMALPDWGTEVRSVSLGPFPSNLLFVGRRRH